LNSIIGNAVAAVRFITTRRGEFTVAEMSEYMGLNKPSGAYRYLDALSVYYPIAEVQEYKRGSGLGRGAVAARFIINEDVCPIPVERRVPWGDTQKWSG
jgi:hypothetical protein